MMPWSVSIAPVWTLTRMKLPPHAAQSASAARASLRRTLKPMGNFTACCTARPATAIAATVSGPTLDLVNGASPKFSMNTACAPPRS